MAWRDLIGQEHIKETLRRVLASERVAHAYLFHGPAGVGKRAIAIEFAKMLQCERGDGEACDQCKACHKVNHMTHPDVQVLIPYPSDVDTSDVAARLLQIAEHPYKAVDFVRRPSLRNTSTASNKQVFYSVARINAELRRSMSFKPLEGRYKVVIMTDADMMRVAAANAFLKLLEEPGPQTLFILTTSRQDRLLPTILSRCQRMRFDLLDARDLELALVERDGIDTGHAAALARMANGSYTRALDLSENEDLMANRALVVEFMRLAYTLNIEKLSGQIEQLSRMGRERIKGILRLMMTWVRDLVLFQAMGNEAELVNVDQQDAIARFCNNVAYADLGALIRLIEEAIDLVERNVQLTLILTSLAHALSRAMKSTYDAGLYVPLVERTSLIVN